MHEHDYEIIMALAEGTLDEAATAAAEAAISACVECSADLELQRFAIAAADEAPDVYLTATESARLHQALKTELVGATTPPIRAKSSFAWGRWLPVAGIAAVFLVAIVSLPALFGGFSADDASDATEVAALETTAASAEMADTTAAPAMGAVPRDGGEADMMESTDATAFEDSLVDAASETTAAPETTTTASATTETTTSDDNSVIGTVPFLGNLDDLDTDDLIEIYLSDREASDETSARAASLDPQFATCVLNNTTPENALSLGLPIDSEPVILGIVVTPIGEELVLVAYVPEDINQTVFTTQQAYFCELVEVLP